MQFDLDRVVFALHAASTLYMAGVIWLVQLAQYPLFARIPPDAFRAYHDAYLRRVTFVVGPAMLVETATGVLLVYGTPAWVPQHLAWIGMALLFALWISTAVLQVPLHRRLERAHDPAAIRRLVATNWVRTLAWTARAGLVLTLLLDGGARAAR